MNEEQWAIRNKKDAEGEWLANSFVRKRKNSIGKA